MSAFLILKQIFYLFNVYMAWFLFKNYWIWLDYDLMASFGEKAFSILVGNLNLGRTYLITAVVKIQFIKFNFIKLIFQKSSADRQEERFV